MLLLKTQMLLITLRGWPMLKRDFMSILNMSKFALNCVNISPYVRSWKDTVLDKHLPIDQRKIVSNWEYPVKNVYSKVKTKKLQFY